MRQATVLLSAALLPAAVLAVQRRGGPAFDRRVAVNAARTIDRSNEAAEAKILDPQTECSYYNYAPVNEIVSFSGRKLRCLSSDSSLATGYQHHLRD